MDHADADLDQPPDLGLTEAQLAALQSILDHDQAWRPIDDFDRATLGELEALGYVVRWALAKPIGTVATLTP